jgi:hypothetical protein
MTYTVPSPSNTSYAAPSNGRSDAIHEHVGSVAEEPTFVDNAVHHVIYKPAQNNGLTSQVDKPNQADFQSSHPRRYRFSEESAGVRLAHTTHEDAPFFDGERLSPTSKRPMLLYDSTDTSLRLRTDNISVSDKGARIALNNMKGRSLAELQMGRTRHVHAGQAVSVGLRSTDLVEKLFTKALHGLNSVATKGTSALFVAKNFNSLVLPSAIRSVARHDHFVIYYDRFGNFLYAPKVFQVKDRTLGIQRGVGETSIDPVVDVANRVIVRGKGIAVNDVISVQVDDAELQKKHGSIKQMTTFDPTANNETAARKSANQALRLNRKAQGGLVSKRHTLSWDLEPGDIVEYDSPVGSVRQALIEVNHSSTGESDFQMISYEAGLESVLTGFGDSGDVEAEDDEVDRTFQIVKINKSGVGGSQLRVKGALSVRPVITTLARTRTSGINTSPDIHGGVLLAHRSVGYGGGRSALGFGITPRINGTHSGGTITVTSTDGFADSGHLILDNQSFVSYSGRTATTFTGATLVSGAAIPSPIGEIRMLRPRAHEMRTVKGKKIRRKI